MPRLKQFTLVAVLKLLPSTTPYIWQTLHSRFLLIKRKFQFFVTRACGYSNIINRVENFTEIARTLIIVNIRHNELQVSIMNICQFNSRNSFAQIRDILSSCKENLMHLFCVAWSLTLRKTWKPSCVAITKKKLYQCIILYALYKSLHKGGVKKQFCICRNLRC